MNLTLRGWACLIGGALWAAFAVAAGTPGLAFPGLFLAALPLVALVTMIPARVRAQARRRLADTPVTVGQPFAWHVDLRLGGWNPGGDGDLAETVAPALGASLSVPFPTGAAARRMSVTLQAAAAWRGRHQIGPSTLTVRHTLGLARTRLSVPDTDSVLVMPPVYPLGPGAGMPAADGGASSTSQRAGITGVDDAMIRDYRVGDDIRRVHWRSTARLGDLMVRGEENTWDPQACLILDTRSHAYGDARPDARFEAAVSLIASLAVHLLRRGYRVALADTSGGMLALDADPVLAEREALVWLADIGCDGASWALDDGLAELSGYLVAAVLADVDEDTVRRLTGAVPRGSSRWALALAGSAPLDVGDVDLFRDAGWSCAPVTSATPAYEAWQPCLSGAAR